MSGGPRFSIVIPTYNRLDFLKQALSSVWTQTFTDYEVVVVDDGSTDRTWDWLAVQGKRIRAIRQPNRGPGAARNFGAREAQGNYVALLDSDDLWFPWTLDVFSWAIRKYGCPNILAGKYLEFIDETKLLEVREGSYKAVLFADYLTSSRDPLSVGSGTCVFRREALVATKFLEDRLNAEDHDLILRMGTLHSFVQIEAPVTVAWRRHPASETGVSANNISGALRLLARERSGAYPGGAKRSRERHRILARHIRATALACVRKGELKQGWQLYRSIFCWNVGLGHWKYLLALPILASLGLLKRAITRIPRLV